MFDNPILKILMDQYGHIGNLDQLQTAMRDDGFGDFVDLLNDNSELIDSFVAEHREDIEQSLQQYMGSGTIPIQEPVQGLPLTDYDSFKFDSRVCLTDCDGKCCKGRNYLMISYPDIFKLLTSLAACHLRINSTRNLFEHKPPIIELFMNEEYDLWFYLLILWYFIPEFIAIKQIIIQIDDIYKANKKCEEDVKTIITPDQLEEEMHPSHAVCASTQNMVYKNRSSTIQYKRPIYCYHDSLCSY